MTGKRESNPAPGTPPPEPGAGKRIVICCDGTWQDLRASYPTNVVRMAQAVLPATADGRPQLVYYDEGVGTGNAPDRMLGGAFGAGLERSLADVYRFLTLNHQPGDEVFLFGFSRGAYTVRSLAGLIYASGLPGRRHIRRIPLAVDLYRDRDVHPDDDDAVRFRGRYGERIPIRLLACWDTVGALGIPDLLPGLPFDEWLNERHQFHDTRLNPCIEHALHAVAVDKIRSHFDVTPMTPSRRNPDQVVRQAWFPGDHSRIGGGTREGRGLADQTLLWMIGSVDRLGLGLETDPGRIPDGLAPDPLADFDNTPRGWNRLGTAQRRRVTGYADLHDSVRVRWRDRPDYRPPNLKRYARELDAWTGTEIPA